MDGMEAELLGRCAAGETGAFSGIVETYQDRVYSFALRLLKDPAAAEEAAQETFVKAFRAIATYDSAYSFSPWLFRIAHNACMDALRAAGRNSSIDEKDFPDIADPAPGVEETVADSMDSERIGAMLAALPPIYSEVLLLQYREEMGPAEIGRVIGAPEGTVKARLFRGREILKKMLRDATVQAAKS